MFRQPFLKESLIFKNRSIEELNIDKNFILDLNLEK